MNKVLKIFLLLLLVLAFYPGNAQVKVWIEAPGDTVETPFKAAVRASGFTNMAYFQFSINWDASNFQLIELDSLNKELPLDTVNINTAAANRGVLNTLWVDFSGEGKSLPDSSVLFDIHFSVVADTCKSEWITLSGEPIPIVFGDTTGQLIPDTMSAEVICGINNVIGKPFVRTLKTFPNPVIDHLYIELDLIRPEAVGIEIINGEGNVMARSTFTQNQKIKTRYAFDRFPVGMYFVRIRNFEGGVTTRKVVKVEK